MRQESGSRALRRGLAMAVLVGVAAGAAACSFFLDLQTSQCSNDSDCTKFGANYQCLAATCVARDASVQDDSATNDASDPDTGFDAGPECTRNADCLGPNSHGDPYFCDKTAGRCVKINHSNEAGVPICTLPNYPELYGQAAPNQLTDDNDILIGAFVTIGPGSLGTVPPINYEAALNEIHKAGGIPGGQNSRSRPLSIVYCDSDPTKAAEGVDHLVNTLKVPAVLAGFTDTAAVPFMETMRDKGVFTLNPNQTPGGLKGRDEKQLVWNLLGLPDGLGDAYVPLIKKLVPYWNGMHPVDGGAPPIKVALITSGNAANGSGCPTEQAIRDRILDRTAGIQFNGLAALDNDAAHFLNLTVPCADADPSLLTANTYASYVQQVFDFSPNIIISLTAEETDLLVEPIETAMHNGGVPDAGSTDGGVPDAGSTDAGAPAPLPLWVFSTRNDVQQAVLDYLTNVSNGQNSTQKTARFFGVQFAEAVDPTQRNNWLDRMKLWTNAPATVYSGSENFYDAIYWLAYGLYAAGQGATVSGVSFATGVRNLLLDPDAGPVIHTGDVNQAFTTMATNPGGVMFEGTLGPPNYPGANKTTGIPQTIGSVYCYMPAPPTASPRYDVLRYNPSTGKLDPSTLPSRQLCNIF